MDKWQELKNWVTREIDNFKDLADEAQFNYPNPQEYDRLNTRMNEFKQFKSKMEEIERLDKHKYKCHRCGKVTTGQQWDESSKKVWKSENIISINDGYNNGECLAWICPECGGVIGEENIQKII